MKLDDNDFDLFGVPQRFAQQRPELDARWRALQAEVHPDRFASEATIFQSGRETVPYTQLEHKRCKQDLSKVFWSTGPSELHVTLNAATSCRFP